MAIHWSEWDAQVGPLFAGFIKVLPVFLMVFPGVIAYVLFRDKIGEDADATLSVLILELLPRGMQGLVLAGLLAAMMSTVAGALNSTATLVSIDIVKRVRPRIDYENLRHPLHAPGVDLVCDLQRNLRHC